MTGRFHIAMSLDDGPTGGGNQFLKALRGAWRATARYAEDPSSADVVLFNSFQHLRAAADLRARLPKAVFLHRADGSRAYTIRRTIRETRWRFARIDFSPTEPSSKPNGAVMHICDWDGPVIGRISSSATRPIPRSSVPDRNVDARHDHVSSSRHGRTIRTKVLMFWTGWRRTRQDSISM